MKRVGVFICNYNKKEYLKKNLESIRKQSYKEKDIFVIDNASTDGAPDLVAELFPEVNLVCNKENIGGAGGFNQAQHIGFDKGYEYILMLDNDIVLDERAIELLVSFLDEHEDVGVVGPAI